LEREVSANRDGKAALHSSRRPKRRQAAALQIYLDIEVHTELERMWSHSQRLNLLLPFITNPAVN
jgi:hypothetical protein